MVLETREEAVGEVWGRKGIRDCNAREKRLGSYKPLRRELDLNHPTCRAVVEKSLLGFRKGRVGVLQQLLPEKLERRKVGDEVDHLE